MAARRALLLSLGLACAAGVRAQAGSPPGIPNFGTVTPRLCRGGQPTTEGFAGLKALGVAVVINLRNGERQIEAERRVVESLGMRYVSIPTSGTRTPSVACVAGFLATVAAAGGERVFVHCRRGAERTGVMVAAYRIAAQGWDAEHALAEMDTYGFRGFLYPHFKRLVRDLPRALASDPALRSLCLAPAGP